MKTAFGLAIMALALVSCAHAFVVPNSLSMNRATSPSALSMSIVVVVSPPGGVGEVTAVKAASMGSTVKWFVVSSKSAKQSQSISFSQEALSQIKAAGGSVELAGADSQALVYEADALAAVRTWCSASGTVDALVCCMDGAEADNVVNEFEEEVDPAVLWQNAVKLAAKEAASIGIVGRKLAILSADEDDDDDDDDAEEGGGFFGGLLGGKNAGMKIPSSIASAIKADTKLRHGTLFGVPESSPNFSALVGGPQKAATVCDEYTMRSVRIDPSISISGNAAMGATTQSCRHAVGEAAALMSIDKVTVPDDVCVTSLRGTDKFDLWQEEFERVNDMMKSGQGAQLFTTTFASVPSVDRLSSWMATKWAPAVMRTYDIAAIRTGARPVFATQLEEGVVEIVWQVLMDNYESVTAGRMTIRINSDGMVATRGPGDPSKGFGSISRKPLPGEAVLVRRLADAASQAIEKGLAKKPASAAKPVEVKKPEPAVVSSLQSAKTVVAEPEAASSGPRTSGAKRSSERTRGQRTRRAAPEEAPAAAAETKSEPGAFE